MDIKEATIEILMDELVERSQSAVVCLLVKNPDDRPMFYYDYFGEHVEILGLAEYVKIQAQKSYDEMPDEENNC
jgi:hypothetical protein